MYPCNFVRELLFFINKYKSIVIIVINIISIKENILIVRGVIVEAKPSINKILKMFEPIIFPMAISVSPFFVATLEEKYLQLQLLSQLNFRSYQE